MQVRTMQPQSYHPILPRTLAKIETGIAPNDPESPEVVNYPDLKITYDNQLRGSLELALHLDVKEDLDLSSRVSPFYKMNIYRLIEEARSNSAGPNVMLAPVLAQALYIDPKSVVIDSRLTFAIDEIDRVEGKPAALGASHRITLTREGHPFTFNEKREGLGKDERLASLPWFFANNGARLASLINYVNGDVYVFLDTQSLPSMSDADVTRTIRELKLTVRVKLVMVKPTDEE